MMGALSYLFNDQAPAAVTQSAASATGLPDWYNEYIKGIAGKGVELAGAAQNQGIPQQSVAGFTPDQIQAFQQVRSNQGSWQPYTDQAGGMFRDAVGAATGAAGAANGAVAGPAASWTDSGTMSQYMSPYTEGVVNEIARLGNKNFQYNIMPQIQGAAMGAGQFGSTRNATMLANAATDTQSNITGQQASALQAGYGTAANIFAQDANRQQQQQSTQAQTALQGGSLASGAMSGAGSNLGALGQTVAGLGLQDAQALQATGQQQQQLNQLGLDTAYNNQVGQNNWDWNTLNNLNSIVRGAQLPTTQTASTSGPLSRTYSPSPLSTLGATYASVAGS